MSTGIGLEDKKLLDDVCKLMNCRVDIDYPAPKIKRSAGKHITITTSLFMIFFILFVHTFTSFRIWDLSVFNISIPFSIIRNIITTAAAALIVISVILGSLGISLAPCFPCCVDSCCSCFACGMSIGGAFSDPWADYYKQKLQREKNFRKFLISLFILTILAIILISIDVAIISINGLLISMGVAAGVAIAIYVSSWFSEVAIRNRIQKNDVRKAADDFSKIKNEIPIEFIAKLLKEITVSEKQAHELSQSHPGRIYMYFLSIIGILLWDKFNETEIQLIKDDFYNFLIKSKEKLLCIKNEPESQLIDNLPKYSISEKASFVDFLIQYFDEARLSKNFNLDYLYVYQHLSKELKQSQYDILAIQSN